MTLSHILPCRVVQQMNEPQHVVIVIQRFAAAHEHHAGNPLSQILLNGVNLRKHFRRCQASFYAVQCRSAEFAAHTAPCLCRNTDRIPIIILHQNTFDDGAIFQGKQVFSGSIFFGKEPFHHFHAADFCFLF